MSPSLTLALRTAAVDARALDAARATFGPDAARLRAAGRTVGAFLDVAGTAFGRATHYNTRDEQRAAEARVHDAALALHRGLYTVLAGLPGATDRTRMLAASRLLARPCADAAAARAEAARIDALVGRLPAPRRYRLFAELARARVNNRRTRTLIFRTILAEDRLELHAVKYRAKIRAALRHALGVRGVGGLKRSLRDGDAFPAVDRFARDAALAREALAFVLGVPGARTRPLFAKFDAAKRDLHAGAGLPLEVLEGLRSTYHPAEPAGTAVRVARGSLTAKQRLRVQARAEKAGVEVAFDPRAHDAVELYVYAFARGLTDEVAAALDEKAGAAAARLPLRYGKVGVVVDASASMAGSEEQPLRPMAAALALRDVLLAGADAADVRVCGGEPDGRLVRPAGHAEIAEALVAMLREDPDAVFLVTDGYENTPAGRTAETIALVRSLGIRTPIYQLAPVFGAEAHGVRRLSAEAPALPVARPAGFGLALLRGLLDQDPLPALAGLLRLDPSREEDPR